jgi:hypothetical protein
LTFTLNNTCVSCSSKLDCSCLITRPNICSEEWRQYFKQNIVQHQSTRTFAQKSNWYWGRNKKKEKKKEY